MPEPNDQSISAKADAAFRQAADRVVRLARQTGTPIIVWDDERGEVQGITPDEVLERLSGSPPPGNTPD